MLMRTTNNCLNAISLPLWSAFHLTQCIGLKKVTVYGKKKNTEGIFANCLCASISMAFLAG